MQRRKFSREFKLEAVKLVRERGVSVSQRSINLGSPPAIVAEGMPPLRRRLLHRYGPSMLE